MNIHKMLKEAQRMQEKLAAAQADVAAQTFEATAGGGKITVTVNGSGDVQKLKIDPSVADPNDIEALEDLLLAGLRKAQDDAREASAAKMKSLTGGLNIPGLSL